MKENFHEMNSSLLKHPLLPSEMTEIPKVLFQTYMDKSRIPQEVFDNVTQFAKEYLHVIYDDKESLQMIQDYYTDSVTEIFHLLQGPHRADLIRYCYLYLFGGIYMDIKTELIKPLSEIFTSNVLYTVLSYGDAHIHQGIIAVKPRHPLFLELIQHMVNIKIPSHYHEFTNYFLYQIKKDTDGKIVQGLNQGNKYKYFILKENCSNDASQCHDGLDRYQLCCYVYENELPVIKTRRSSYPW
jgi:hypothetical protein